MQDNSMTTKSHWPELNYFVYKAVRQMDKREDDVNTFSIA